MKANELMIGDWVLRNGEPYQIRELGIYGVNRDGEDYPAVCIGKPKGVGLIVERNEINPIPLTVEILERNFVKNGTNRYVVYGGNSYIKDMTNFFELHINFVDFKLEQQIFYVHKLQHALRLCGIEKEIEL